MKQAVLLLAHGAPEHLEDIDQYLLNVRGGRPMAPPVIEEIRRRYALIGGGSPLLARTREQAQALQAELGPSLGVYFGMRNWSPYIADAMRQMQADGVNRILALCLAPQYSRMSVGVYFRRTQEAKRQLGYGAEIIWAKTLHGHPLLVEAFAEKIAPLAANRPVLFTAHSLPEKILEDGDLYDAEARATAGAVASRLGLPQWDFAYQSQGMTAEKWLGPTVESKLDAWAAAGVKEIVIAPIGFVADHVEILYDVDILFRQYARDRGIEIFRSQSLNASPRFIAALAEVARGRLQAA